MPSQRYQHIFVFGLFLVLTLVMTFPMVLHLGTSVRDRGDPLLNTWIMAWNNRQMTGFNLAGWFDANIYYPNRNTLAYSEHLFPQALIGLPINLLTGNPILAYNFVLLLAFITSAFGMYLLAYHLTRHAWGSIAAGFIFAFSPFMIAHLFQIQVISAAGIPLTFLFLIRFYDSGRWKDLLLFTLFFVLQALANGYYALFLTVMTGLLMLILTTARRKWLDARFWVQMGVFACLSLAALVPFLSHYSQVRNTLGLERGIGAYARATTFLATSRQNVLYGQLSHPFQKAEGELFPGVAPFLLAVVGGWSILRLQKRPRVDSRPKPRRGGRFLLWLAFVLFLVQTLFLYLTLSRGSFELSWGSLLNIHARSPLKPLLTWAATVLAFWIVKKAFRTGPLLPFTMKDPALWGLGLVFLAALSITLGPGGPFLILYRHVPGFEALRAPTRCHVFIMLSLAIFAAFGLRALAQKMSGQRKGVFIFLALLLILAEFLSPPIPLESVPVKSQIPPVYHWLATHKYRDFALLELPFPQEGQGIGTVECPRAYYSTYHWKRLVNGYSGYFPPVYSELRRRWNGGCSARQNISDLRSLGVRYMVFHSSMFPPEAFPILLRDLASLPSQTTFIGQFGEAFVYEVLGWEDGLRDLRAESARVPAERHGWKVTASDNKESAALAIDGRRDTRWDTAGPQKPGQFFEVDLGRELRLAKLSLVLGSSALDFPRGFQVEVSLDGSTWVQASRQDQTLIDIRAFLRPRELGLEIPLADVPARKIRIINTGQDPVLYWSIHELKVYSSR
jgi:hypothetical protein